MGSSAYSYYDKSDIRDKLIGMHKNNAITRENLELLTNKKFNDSYDDLIAILNAEKDCLYKRLDRETLARASTNTFAKISRYCAGLIGGIPAGGFAGWLVSIPVVAYNNAAWDNYNLCKDNGLPTRWIKARIVLPGYNKNTGTYNNGSVSVSTTTIKPTFDSDVLEKTIQMLGLIAGVTIAVNCGIALYDYCTAVKKNKAEIQRINDIIGQLDALRANG
jgi:hypothetical protein